MQKNQLNEKEKSDIRLMLNSTVMRKVVTSHTSSVRLHKFSWRWVFASERVHFTCQFESYIDVFLSLLDSGCDCMNALFWCCSEDESELSDNEKEPADKSEGLLNGTSNGLSINGSLSRDGELTCFSSLSVRNQFFTCSLIWCTYTLYKQYKFYNIYINIHVSYWWEAWFLSHSALPVTDWITALGIWASNKHFCL